MLLFLLFAEHLTLKWKEIFLLPHFPRCVLQRCGVCHLFFTFCRTNGDGYYFLWSLECHIIFWTPQHQKKYGPTTTNQPKIQEMCICVLPSLRQIIDRKLRTFHSHTKNKNGKEMFNNNDENSKATHNFFYFLLPNSFFILFRIFFYFRFSCCSVITFRL